MLGALAHGSSGRCLKGLTRPALMPQPRYPATAATMCKLFIGIKAAIVVERGDRSACARGERKMSIHDLSAHHSSLRNELAAHVPCA
jgi:hypothetical protein